jgi:hypothetical protein
LLSGNTFALSSCCAAAAAAVLAVQAHARLPREGAADLLQLALNCSSTTAAATAVRLLPATAAARRMPELLEPDVARRLLVTAATGQHAAAVHEIMTHRQLAYLKEHIDAATLEAMMFELHHRYVAMDLLTRLTVLPAAEHLSSEAVTRLLLDATARDQFSTIRLLCRLPAAQQFDTAAMMELLQAAIRRSHVPLSFLGLLAAQQLSSGDVSQLLLAAMPLAWSLAGNGSIEHLCNLPGAQQMNRQGVLQLLQAALQHDGEYYRLNIVVIGRVIRHLCELPAAEQLDSQAVLQLLPAAVLQRMDAGGLCKLPAAEQLDRQTVLRLLLAAVQPGSRA